MDYDTSFLPFMCTAFGDVFAYVKKFKIEKITLFI